MRTSDQIKRKYNEFAAQKRALEDRITAADGAVDKAPLEAATARLDEQMLLLEWVLNEPLGRYHA